MANGRCDSRSPDLIMKIGIIADIHGNFPAFREVIPALYEECDEILFLGDLCGYYPFVAECLELWDFEKITAIRGNHDQILIDALEAGTAPVTEYTKKYGTGLARSLEALTQEQKDWFLSLPITRTLERGGKKIALFHGTPWDPLNGRVFADSPGNERFLETDADLILLGQTHYPAHFQVGEITVANPGSIGQPRDHGNGASYALLDLEKMKFEFKRVSYPKEELISDAQKNNPEIPYLVEVLNRKVKN